MISTLYQLPLGLLSLSYLVAATPTAALHKRDPTQDVLHGSNFPDPCIIDVDGTSYAFGTVDGAGHSVPVASNPDFGDTGGWSGLSDAFPPDNVPAFASWAAPNTVWAPDVNQLVCIK